MAEQAPPAAGSEPEVGHVVPWTVLLGTCIGLLLLTATTVSAGLWARTVEIGSLGLWIALLIATIKASLVCLYFMHLRYDRPFNRFVWLTSFAFVALFIGLTMTDAVSYESEKYKPRHEDYANALTEARATHALSASAGE